jgi:hypothetical protein
MNPIIASQADMAPNANLECKVLLISKAEHRTVVLQVEILPLSKQNWDDGDPTTPVWAARSTGRFALCWMHRSGSYLPCVTEDKIPTSVSISGAAPSVFLWSNLCHNSAQ